MYSASNLGARGMEFFDFVNRLPLSDEQKKDFVKTQIEICKTHQLEKKENKKYFSDNVMCLIGLDSPTLIRT
tara:strand:- start:762 stop:977 length:216 start_codon:yes stop_codon:yes gene_type:complete